MDSEESAPDLQPPPESGRDPEKRRRAEDRAVGLLLGSPELLPTLAGVPDIERIALGVLGYEVGLAPGGASIVPIGGMPGTSGEVAFVLDLGTAEALLITGADIRPLPRGDGGQDLLQRAAAGAAVWRRERQRIDRRLQLPDQLIAFSDGLNRSQRPMEICEALAEHTPRIVGGYSAIVFLRDAGGTKLQAIQTPQLPIDVHRLSLPLLPRLAQPGLITATDVQPDTGGPFQNLAPLFTETRAAVAAHVPLGEGGVLVLIERRDERMFEAEDWDLLRTLASQATTALERVHLFNEVRDLSLTDPLTGLANRRRMAVVLEHSIAAARRGEGLALMMVDLDKFKQLNDEHGHVVGDRMLVEVAEYLRDEARGSDLVVRYGGDEFLVVLPGGNRAGARILLQRVRERLGDRVQISAGIAEYQPGIRSAEELIDAADRDLYRAKNERDQAPESGAGEELGTAAERRSRRRGGLPPL